MSSSTPASADLRPFVVTGCARSGTTYMAALLSGIGLRVGHEVVFGPRTRRFEGWQGQHGDSSWLAAPFLDQIDDALVFHQVRHPLKVVKSLVGVRFFADRGQIFLQGDDAYTRAKWKVREALMAAGHVERSAKGPRPHKVYRAYLDAYAPQLWRHPTEVERALDYWMTWTRLVTEKARPEHYDVHPVESLSPGFVAEMLWRVGLPVSDGHVALAMDKVPQDLNTRKVASLEWRDIPDGPLKRAAAAYAEELGYVPADPSARPGATSR
ncbi:MAG: hypothetical protein KDB63_18895 [Nocardioidaceae bacterium]|nr:hypothetical protein [Nocardioidaceae bacterium]